MPARLKFLTVSPARLESFAQAPRKFAGRPGGRWTHLTGWRLRLAAQALTSSPKGVADIAAAVGYESEAAFNRAFKRAFGAPPAPVSTPEQEPRELTTIAGAEGVRRRQGERRCALSSLETAGASNQACIC